MGKGTTIFRNIFFNLIVFIVCCISIIVAILGENEMYQTLWLLPLGYMVIYFMSLAVLKDKVFRNIGYILFWGQSIIKCVIAPLILCLGNYTSLFRDLQEQYIFHSVLLMLYEQLACTFVIAFASADKQRVKFIVPNMGGLPKLTFGTFIAMFSVFMFGIWIIVPSIQNNFVTIFDMFSSQQMFLGYDYISANTSGASGRIFTTLILVLFKSFRIIFPFFIIRGLKERYGNAGSFVVSILVVLLQFLFISETVAMALVVAFMLLSYMFRIYPKYQKTVIGLMVFSSAFAIFVLSLNFDFMSKWYGVGNITEYASQVLQSYVPGVCNTASIFRLDRVSRLSSLWDTLISTIPFQNTIFGSVSWTNDLNTVFTSVSGLGAQICSTIGGGWYIFGALGAPIFSMLFTYVSIVNGYKYSQTDNDLERLLYLFMCIQSILGIGVYNIQTTITLWIQTGVILWISTKLSAVRKVAGGGGGGGN